MWQDLLAALALVFVLEGILPFANPGAVRRALKAIDDLNDGQLRGVGLASMLLGLLLLFAVKHWP
ncbi:MAG TPA: DUF2065 domain-containing protein [Burkholderiales bacterium]